MDDTAQLLAAKAAPLSYEQEQLWFMHELMPDVPLDSECVMVTLRGELDGEALQESLAAFIQRHEIWRTSFPCRDGQPVQAVHEQGQWTWLAADLSGLAEPERDQEALRRAEEDARQPFDLARGPLVRALLVRLGEQEHRLFMTLHRSSATGSRWRRSSCRNCGSCMRRGSRDGRMKLDEVELQYGGLCELAAGKAAGRGAACTPEVLEGVPGGRADRPGAAGGPPAAGTAELPGRDAGICAERELSAGLRELSRQEQVKLPMTLTAAFATLLHRYTGQEDLLLGLSVSQRSRAEVQRTMGCSSSARWCCARI